ncbi:hypothetical protein B0H16DRAFT_1885586 [Mycena metata]|uniref:Proteophosphoglycan ppg4 n=1 Tax=Mycena metata TaxID=1033252 RepID=A0AAD7J642_9AGAR|nr:hypothetical protein B0H16DRAFT_1885586 [Mycena metata]
MKYRPRRLPCFALLAVAAAYDAQAIPPPRASYDLDVFAAVDIHSTTSTRRHVPPQYSPDLNGVWKRVEPYTLVGSTVCDTCSEPTTSISETDEDFRASIPSGWVRDSVATPIRTTITVVLSVVLACFIVVAIFRFHLTRKPQPRPDLEKRCHPSTSSVNVVNEKTTTASAKGPARKWMTRASARWRDNARYLARQRRGRRHTPASRKASLESLVSVSPAASIDRAPSPVPSTSSTSNSISTSASASASASTSSLTSPGEDPPPPAPEPPAYPISMPPRLPRGKARAADDNGEFDPEADEFPPYTPRAAADSADGEGEGYFAPHAAHVATDDKALLARLAQGVSAPGGSACAAMPTEVGVCVEGEVAMAPEEDELGLDIGVEEESCLPQAASSSHLPALPQSQSGPQLRLPPPPPARAWGGEKMALERAWEAAASSSSTFPDAYPSTSNPPNSNPTPTPRPSTSNPTLGSTAASKRREAYGDAAEEDVYDVPAYPSHPPYEEAGPSTPRAPAPSAPAYPSYPHPYESAEAGPSTPRAVVVGASASAPPLWDDDEDDYEEEYGEYDHEEYGASAPALDFEDEEEGGEVYHEHEQKQRRQQQRQEESELETEPTEPEHRERQGAGQGEAHDTGWSLSDAVPLPLHLGALAGEGQGQGHDR